MKSRTGYIFYDEGRKRWIARFAPVDAESGKQREFKRYCLTKTEARKKLQELVNNYEQRGPVLIAAERMTFADLASEYEEKRIIPAQYIGEKKVAGMRNTISPKLFLKSLTDHFGKKRLTAITHADLENYKLVLIKRPTRAGGKRTIASVNRELEFFRTVLNYAVTNGKLARNPFTLGKGRPLIERASETKRERFPTFGEELAIIKVCTDAREHLRAILIVAADTGLRRNELFTLSPADLDFDRQIINVRAINAKTNRVRQIPMTRRVHEELMRLVEQKPEKYIFGGITEVKRSFGTACRLNGINDLHFHDLRHAFVSRSILAGVPPAVALKASGHASEEWKRYLNMTPNQLQKLFKPLESQNAEEVKAYGLDVLRQLRDALGYSEIANLIASLGSQG
ncbi:MAG TPA: site-specific integrase [Blastocatellia bacterium]|nr:site-specific integrase [Blastocatellia bacterium]